MLLPLLLNNLLEPASGALSGSSSLTFTASGTLKGDGALSGSSSLTFTGAGTITGTGDLSGSSSLTFSPAGTIKGAGALSGSSSVTFAPTGTLKGDGALSGTATVTFTPSGTLTNAAPGALTGSSSITFSTAGTLTGTGALSGSSSLTFTATGDFGVVAQKKGGRSKKFKRYVVEIDGQDIIVSSVAEAQALLAQAEQLAEEVAPRDVRKADQPIRIKPPRIAIRTAKGNKTSSIALQRSVRDTREAVADIYRKAAQEMQREREISAILQRKLQDEDDEEAITALLL